MPSGDGALQFSVMLPEVAFRAGPNELEALIFEEGTKEALLAKAPPPVEQGREKKRAP